MVEAVGVGVEGGFAGLDGLVEGGDFAVEGEDAVAEGGLGGDAEAEEMADEFFTIEGFGDVEVAQGVAPLGGDEGDVGAVVETEGFAAVDVEGEFVGSVGDGEGCAGLEVGVEGVEVSLEGGGVLLLGPGGEVAAFEVGGGLRRLLPGGGGADFGPQPVFLGRGTHGRGLAAVQALVELGDGVAAQRVECLQFAGEDADLLALCGRGVGDGERGDELFVGFVVAAFFVFRGAAENKVADWCVQNTEEIPRI